ncbi:hypothetical protein ABMA79_08955 [Halobacteriovorax sp. HFRX-2_2]|uniref:hypothetical protein n=1 Tax=unclassified Halobacteriovorax TaxID=2639665 RepID=UPI0037209027
MKFLLCFLFSFLFLLGCSEFVIRRKPNTCLTSKKYPEVYQVMRQWGWDVWLKETGIENAPTFRYTNDSKWKEVECPKE